MNLKGVLLLRGRMVVSGELLAVEEHRLDSLALYHDVFFVTLQELKQVGQRGHRVNVFKLFEKSQIYLVPLAEATQGLAHRNHDV